LPDYISISFAAILVTALGALVIASVVATFFPHIAFSKWLSHSLERKPKNLADFNDQEWFSLSDISIVEKYIPNIESVVVISSVVQNPDGALMDAVRDNFQQGARYAFYVSKSGTTAADLETYRGWFESIFAYAKKAAPTSGENSKIHEAHFEDHFSALRLDFDWSSAPYIFYTYNDQEQGRSIIAFRGDAEGVGICDLYNRVDPNLAADILNLASAASHEFAEEVSADPAGLETDLPAAPIETTNVTSLVDRIVRKAQNR
jgi:hypothetical protein